jgi:hypothetical protein
VSELKLLRELRLGSRGKDVCAMKRGLARSGHGTLAGSFNPLMGPFAVQHLKNFQHKHALGPTGAYDAATHAKLIQFFDQLAIKLYKDAEWEPKGEGGATTHTGDGGLQLPSTFVPTHETAGLPGFPATDQFAAPGTTVLAPEDGVVDRHSGHDPALGGKPGGPYGWSIYITAASGRYYLTHFGSRQTNVGDHLKKGQAIGTVCDSAVSGKAGTSHIHEGKSKT